MTTPPSGKRVVPFGVSSKFATEDSSPGARELDIASQTTFLLTPMALTELDSDTMAPEITVSDRTLHIAESTIVSFWLRS